MTGRLARAAAWYAASGYAVLAFAPARLWLEASMTLHMLVQIPLLACAGFVAARALPRPWRRRLVALCGGPVPLLLAAVFASSYWMLPRALDVVLVDPRAELAKFITLPLLVGLPLALAWERVGLLGRGLVWSNFISMLAVLGWLYIAAPVRVCNGYLVMQQYDAGMWMVKLSVALLLWWLGGLFVAAPSGTNSAQHHHPRSRPLPAAGRMLEP